MSLLLLDLTFNSDRSEEDRRPDRRSGGCRAPCASPGLLYCN